MSDPMRHCEGCPDKYQLLGMAIRVDPSVPPGSIRIEPRKDRACPGIDAPAGPMREDREKSAAWWTCIEGPACCLSKSGPISDLNLLHRCDVPLYEAPPVTAPAGTVSVPGAEKMADHFEWIANRLVSVYGESENVDFVLAARQYVKQLRALAAGKGGT